jgi:hypothetical protein
VDSPFISSVCRAAADAVPVRTVRDTIPHNRLGALRARGALGALGVAWLVVALAVAGCGRDEDRAPASASAAAVPLRTLSHDTGACRGIGLVDAKLAGDPADPDVAWLILHDGSRRSAVWPAGNSARFAPGLEVLNAAGEVTVRAGDSIRSACVMSGDADRGALLVRPELDSQGATPGPSGTSEQVP